MPSGEALKQLKKKLPSLSPKERLKALKEFEEARNQELGEIEKLISDSKTAIRHDELADSVAPEVEDVNIDQLFENVEQPVSTVEPEKVEEVFAQSAYMSFQQAYSDYKAMQEINYTPAAELSDSQIQTIEQIENRLENVKYLGGGNVAMFMTKTTSAIHHIRRYQGL